MGHRVSYLSDSAGLNFQTARQASASSRHLVCSESGLQLGFSGSHAQQFSLSQSLVPEISLQLGLLILGKEWPSEFDQFQTLPEGVLSSLPSGLRSFLARWKMEYFSLWRKLLYNLGTSFSHVNLNKHNWSLIRTSRLFFSDEGGGEGGLKYSSKCFIHTQNLAVSLFNLVTHYLVGIVEAVKYFTIVSIFFFFFFKNSPTAPFRVKSRYKKLSPCLIQVKDNFRFTSPAQ